MNKSRFESHGSVVQQKYTYEYAGFAVKRISDTFSTVRRKCAARQTSNVLNPAVPRVLPRVGTVVIRNDGFACGTKR